MDIKAFLADYVTFKSISCDASYLSDMAATRKFLLNFLVELGFHAKEIKTEKHNIIFAKNDHKVGRKTVLLYGHYDVQPEGEGWSSDPFKLTEHNGRLYARGASDNKGGNSTFLAALHDLFYENSNFPLNITLILEGEEEIGSPSMFKFLNDYRNELQADFAIVADTWSVDDENIVITTGLRGLVGFELKLRSAKHDLHSGYGGTIINPIRELVKLCSSFHSSDGQINIPGFYDDVELPLEFELEQIKCLPFEDNQFLNDLGVKKLSIDIFKYSAINSMRFYPTLEFNGIKSGYLGDGIKTIIPAEANTKITCRLAWNQNAHKIKKLLEKTILERVDKNLEVTLNFEKSSNPYNLLANKQCFESNSTIGYGLKIADQEIKNIFGKSPLYLRDGGSIALIRLMKDVLSLDSVLVGFSSTEDRIHDSNESISLNMLNKGYEFFKNFLQKLAI